MTGIDVSKRARIAQFSSLIVTGLIWLPLQASAQQVTDAQKSAIRSNCRSDFMSKCSSVTPGGTEAFQCLKKNEASLSAGCRAAVSAIKLPGDTPAAAPAAAKPVETPAAAVRAPTPPPAASTPKPAETKAAVPEPTKPAAPKPTQAKPATAPKPAVAAAPAAPTPPAAPAAAPEATQPKRVTLGEAAIVRRFCTVDYQVLCKGTPIGGGRVIQCLSNNQPALSPKCKEAIALVQ